VEIVASPLHSLTQVGQQQRTVVWLALVALVAQSATRVVRRQGQGVAVVATRCMALVALAVQDTQAIQGWSLQETVRLEQATEQVVVALAALEMPVLHVRAVLEATALAA